LPKVSLTWPNKNKNKLLQRLAKKLSYSTLSKVPPHQPMSALSFLKHSIIAPGDTAVFTLNGTPTRDDLIDVWVNDVLQHPEEIYETIENTIQFFEIPPQGTDIYIKFR